MRDVVRISAGRCARWLVAAAVMTAVSAAAAADARFTPAQLAEVQQRYALARQIVARLEPEAASKGLDGAWRQTTLTQLLASPARELAALAASGSTASVISAIANPVRKTDAKLLGDAASDLVFVPFTPCRYIDTRKYVAGKISGIRTFDLANNGATYGGNAGCDPRTLAAVASEDSIGAIAFNIAYIDTSAGAPGFLTVRPAGSAQVTATLNWYVAAASAQDSNAAISAVNQAGPAEIEVSSSGAVHVIMDLLGAFIAPQATALDCVTVANPSGSTTTGDVVAGAGAIFTATCPTVPAGYTLTGGGCAFFTTSQTPPTATDDKVFINRSQRVFDSVSQTFTNQWVCQWNNTDAITWRVQVRAICCRTPGR